MNIPKTWIDCAIEEVSLLYAGENSFFEVICDGLYVTNEYRGYNLREAIEIYFDCFNYYSRFFVDGQEISWR